MTIIQAIKEVMLQVNKPLTDKEIYKLIIEAKPKPLYEFQSKNPIHIVKTQIRRHCQGLDFPTAKKIKHFTIVEHNRGKSKYFLANKETKKNDDIKKRTDNTGEEYSSEKLPEEIIMDAYQKHKENVKQELLDNILNSEPSFFESMVIELLVEMEYSWDKDKEKSSIINGKVGDGGIDGIIFEDKLGLGKIYIQAKRYTKTTIGRPEIQQFVGAMGSNQKGVYITTSKFTKTAQDYANSSMKDIVLIDGDMLTNLLIENKLGVASVETISTYQIDKDYFEI